MDYLDILAKAKVEAVKAFNACTPTPVQWVSADLFGKPLSEPSEPDMDGECGGAYITGIYGNDPFVRWCKKNNNGLVSKDVYKGYNMSLHVDGYRGQSREKFTAYAQAFAKVLRENGIKCHVKSYQT